MSFFQDAVADAREHRYGEREPEGSRSASQPMQPRQATVTAAGEQVPVEDPQTVQTGDDWLSGTGKYGRPRGRDAIEARRISQTWPMELITNGIVDQLLGGDLAFESDDDETDQVEAELQSLLRDVLEGPHLMDDDLDDLLAAAVADMIGPGNAYWQLLPARDGSLPVVSMVPLDPLTIRHNVDRHGVPKDPPYYQAQSAFTAEGIANLTASEPVPLEREDVAVMRYPGNRRSYQLYPKSPSMQVLEALELIDNSTTHHNRFYSDNEIPPGFLHFMGASNRTIEDLKDKLEAAKGDPRSVEVTGGEGQAMWVEMGGTNVNLSVIEEQKWFLQLCLAAVGLGKAEIGMIEDVNRANGEVEQSRVFKRVTGPFEKQFAAAFKHVAEQFDVYRRLDRPFDIRLRFNDPREERAREQRLRQMWQAGGLTLRQYVRRRGDEDLADNEFTVEINGQEIEYGDHPKFVVEQLFRAARADVPEDQAEDMAEEAAAHLEDEQDVPVPVFGAGGAPGMSGHPDTNGHGDG